MSMTSIFSVLPTLHTPIGLPLPLPPSPSQPPTSSSLSASVKRTERDSDDLLDSSQSRSISSKQARTRYDELSPSSSNTNNTNTNNNAQITLLTNLIIDFIDSANSRQSDVEAAQKELKDDVRDLQTTLKEGLDMMVKTGEVVRELREEQIKCKCQGHLEAIAEKCLDHSGVQSLTVAIGQIGESVKSLQEGMTTMMRLQRARATSIQPDIRSLEEGRKVRSDKSSSSTEIDAGLAIFAFMSNRGAEDEAHVSVENIGDSCDFAQPETGDEQPEISEEGIDTSGHAPHPSTSMSALAEETSPRAVEEPAHSESSDQ